MFEVTRLASRGREANVELLRGFHDLFPERVGLDEHTRVVECVAYTLTRLQPNMASDPKETRKLAYFYNELIQDGRRMKKADVGTYVERQINRLRSKQAVVRKSKRPLKPSKTQGVIRGLQVWAEIDLPDVNGAGLITLTDLQRNIRKEMRVMWVTQAPMKLYALDREVEGTWSKECCLPLSRSVAATIRDLVGPDFGSSETDHKYAQEIQMKMTEAANKNTLHDPEFSILDINSGLE